MPSENILAIQLKYFQTAFFKTSNDTALMSAFKQYFLSQNQPETEILSPPGGIRLARYRRFQVRCTLQKKQCGEMVGITYGKVVLSTSAKNLAYIKISFEKFCHDAKLHFITH